MAISVSESADQFVKSAERVQDLGEVLTPPETVKAMLDALPQDRWNVHPSALFFEPGCGDGNFLVEILKRKLQRVSGSFKRGTLPAGSDREALEFHALEALASIYGVDICPENIVGGKNPDEVGARQRLLSLLIEWHESVTQEALEETSAFLMSAAWIVERNIVVADMLEIRPASNQHATEIPLVEYDWDAEATSVILRRTSLGEAMSEAGERLAGMLSLTRLESKEDWTVHPLKLADVPISAPRIRRRRARNGRGWRTS